MQTTNITTCWKNQVDCWKWNLPLFEVIRLIVESKNLPFVEVIRLLVESKKNVLWTFLWLQLIGMLVNTGNDITLRIDESKTGGANFSDGPLMYTYRLSEVKVHFGKTDTDGSEHSIDGSSFAAEVRVIMYCIFAYLSVLNLVCACEYCVMWILVCVSLCVPVWVSIDVHMDTKTKVSTWMVMLFQGNIWSNITFPSMPRKKWLYICASLPFPYHAKRVEF